MFSGLANYSTNFVNLHQYKKQTVITNKNIARTYIAELVNDNIEHKLKMHYTNICLWLDKITEDYAIKVFGYNKHKLYVFWIKKSIQQMFQPDISFGMKIAVASRLMQFSRQALRAWKSRLN